MGQPCLVAAGVASGGGVDLAIEVATTDELSAEAMQERVVEFYRRLGWEQWTGPISAYDEEGVHPTPERKKGPSLSFASVPQQISSCPCRSVLRPARVTIGKGTIADARHSSAGLSGTDGPKNPPLGRVSRR